MLFWGIFGALIMRGAMIAAGWLMIDHFHWITYVFGAFLLITGIRMAVHEEIQIAPEANPVPILISLFVVASTLALSMLASLIVSKQDAAGSRPDLEAGGGDPPGVGALEPLEWPSALTRVATAR